MTHNAEGGGEQRREGKSKLVVKDGKIVQTNPVEDRISAAVSAALTEAAGHWPTAYEGQWICRCGKLLLGQLYNDNTLFRAFEQHLLSLRPDAKAGETLDNAAIQRERLHGLRSGIQAAVDAIETHPDNEGMTHPEIATALAQRDARVRQLVADAADRLEECAVLIAEISLRVPFLQPLDENCEKPAGYSYKQVAQCYEGEAKTLRAELTRLSALGQGESKDLQGGN